VSVHLSLNYLESWGKDSREISSCLWEEFSTTIFGDSIGEREHYFLKFGSRVILFGIHFLLCFSTFPLFKTIFIFSYFTQNVIKNIEFPSFFKLFGKPKKCHSPSRLRGETFFPFVTLLLTVREKHFSLYC
jgi:hypothetical protein